MLTVALTSFKLEAMNIEETAAMDPNIRLRADKHAALADPARLAIVDALWLGDLSPTQLRELLSMSSNLLAHHLKVLERAGFLTRRRSEGDRRRTYLRLVRSAMDDLLPGPRAAGRGAAGAPVAWCSCAPRTRPARSWRRPGGNASVPVPAASAGTHPATRVHPAAIATGRRHGWVRGPGETPLPSNRCCGDGRPGGRGLRQRPRGAPAGAGTGCTGRFPTRCGSTPTRRSRPPMPTSPAGSSDSPPPDRRPTGQPRTSPGVPHHDAKHAIRHPHLATPGTR